MKRFLDKHPPLTISPNPEEREALNATLAEAERAILRRRQIDTAIKARREWRNRLPELAADAAAVIAERNGDPTEDDLDED